MVDDFSSMSAAFKNLKITSEKVSSVEKDKLKVWITFFENKMEQDTCLLCDSKLICKKIAKIMRLEENQKQARYHLTYSEVSNQNQLYD